MDFKIKNEDEKFKFLYKPNDDSYLMLYTVCKDLLFELTKCIKSFLTNLVILKSQNNTLKQFLYTNIK